MSKRFLIDADASRIKIEARTSVGPVTWVGDGLTGEFMVTLGDDGQLDLEGPSEGTVTVPVTRLGSGNRVYDGELLKRINARRHPTASVQLERAQLLTGTSVIAAAVVVFHNVARSISGTLSLVEQDDGSVLATGEQAIDIRDFGLPVPTMLMLKVYPDVRVSLALVGRAA